MQVYTQSMAILVGKVSKCQQLAPWLTVIIDIIKTPRLVSINFQRIKIVIEGG